MPITIKYKKGYSVPSFNTTSLNDVSDSVLIHLFEFFRAPRVEFLVLDLGLLKVGLTQIGAPHFEGKQFVLLLEGNEKG